MRFLKDFAAAVGNLLGPDIIAETRLYITREGHRSFTGKIETYEQANAIINALLGTAVDLARQSHININWQMLHQAYPPQGGPDGKTHV